MIFILNSKYSKRLTQLEFNIEYVGPEKIQVEVEPLDEYYDSIENLSLDSFTHSGL